VARARHRGSRAVGRGAGKIAEAVAGAARTVPVISQAAVSRIANVSQVTAHGATNLSRAAARAAAMAVAGVARTIAGAVEAATAAARVAARRAAPHVAGGLDALGGAVTGAARATAAAAGAAADAATIASRAVPASSRAAANAAVGAAHAVVAVASDEARGASRAASRGLITISRAVTGSATGVWRAAAAATARSAAGGRATASRVTTLASRTAVCHAVAASRALAGAMTHASDVAVVAAGTAAAASAAVSRAALRASRTAARNVATASRAGAEAATSGSHAAAIGAATAASRAIPVASQALRHGLVVGSGAVIAASGVVAVESQAMVRRLTVLTNRRRDQGPRRRHANGRQLALTSATALAVVGAVTWNVVDRHRGGIAEGPSRVPRVVASSSGSTGEPGHFRAASPSDSAPPTAAGHVIGRTNRHVPARAVPVVTTADDHGQPEGIDAVPRSPESIARTQSEAEPRVEVPDVRAVAATNDATRIQLEIQQTLRSRGLLRENAADRWGVTVEVSPSGDVTLEGAVRDVTLYHEAVRRVQEVAKGRHVTRNIRVIEARDAP
jgi:hypothetical protein